MTDFLVFPERARQTARDETEFVKKKEARRIVSAATSVKAAAEELRQQSHKGLILH
jgi:hypothetical protein